MAIFNSYVKLPEGIFIFLTRTFGLNKYYAPNQMVSSTQFTHCLTAII